MGLADFDPPTKEIKIPGSKASFSVRGLDFDTMVALFRIYTEEIEQLYARFSKEASNMDMDRLKAIGFQALEDVPGLLADLISRCADEPHLVERYRKLPFPVQMEAAESALLLTFEAEGGLKKVIETVIRASRVARLAVADLRPSLSGLPAFAGKSA